MYVVMDWHKTKVYGPFLSKDTAEEWLAKQGIYLGQYDDQEVSVMHLRSTSERLEEIAARA